MQIQTINIPDTAQKRIVILGAGFGGLTLARKLARSGHQIVLIDKNNYHQAEGWQIKEQGFRWLTIVRKNHNTTRRRTL